MYKKKGGAVGVYMGGGDVNILKPRLITNN
jgi:hypothetical protein